MISLSSNELLQTFQSNSLVNDLSPLNHLQRLFSTSNMFSGKRLNVDFKFDYNQ